MTGIDPVETGVGAVPPNNLLQRSVNDKVLGRGRVRNSLAKVMSARVLERTRAVAEQGR
jgi:hypothetical protein